MKRQMKGKREAAKRLFRPYCFGLKNRAAQLRRFCRHPACRSVRGGAGVLGLVRLAAEALLSGRMPTTIDVVGTRAPSRCRGCASGVSSPPLIYGHLPILKSSLFEASAQHRRHRRAVRGGHNI